MSAGAGEVTTEHGATARLTRPYYEDEHCTIYHADCFDLLHDLEGVGAVVTDPPYSSGGAFRGDRAMATTTKYVNNDTAAYRPEFAGDNRDQRAFLAWCTMWMNAARHASVDGAVLASFIDWRQLPILTDAVQAGGWTWRNLATWWKPGVRMQKGRFSASAEYVVYATNGPVIEGAGSPQNVFSCKIDDDREHIAQKPAPVMRWVLQARKFSTSEAWHEGTGRSALRRIVVRRAPAPQPVASVQSVGLQAVRPMTEGAEPIEREASR